MYEFIIIIIYSVQYVFFSYVLPDPVKKSLLLKAYKIAVFYIGNISNVIFFLY